MMPPKPDWKMIFLEKYVIPLFVVGSIALCTGAITIWVSVRDLTSQVRQNTDDIKALQTDMGSLRANAVLRPELLETLKRVEQQLEIILLKARVNEKVKIAKE